MLFSSNVINRNVNAEDEDAAAGRKRENDWAIFHWNIAWINLRGFVAGLCSLEMNLPMSYCIP